MDTLALTVTKLACVRPRKHTFDTWGFPGEVAPGVRGIVGPKQYVTSEVTSATEVTLSQPQ